MKNVVGLASAMRTIEGACEKGEITIIGEGGTPSPVELYKKCVDFINKQYGVDILNLVVNESDKKCECTKIVVIDTEADDHISVDVHKARRIAEDYLCEKTPWLSADAILDIVNGIESYYNRIAKETEVDEYTIDDCAEHIVDIINYNLDCGDLDEDYINDIAESLAEGIDSQCVSID
jgi:hypothetical protein